MSAINLTPLELRTMLDLYTFGRSDALHSVSFLAKDLYYKGIVDRSDPYGALTELGRHWVMLLLSSEPPRRKWVDRSGVEIMLEKQ